MKLLLSILISLAAAALIHGQTPAAIERSILRDLEAIGKHGTYGGNFDGEKNGFANKHLRDTLVRNGARPDVLRYTFPRLKKEMFVTTSPDGQLRAYSWDYQTGGTMHDFGTVYQFQGKSGRVHTWTGVTTGDEEDFSAGSFVHELYQVNARTGPIYLEVSTFIASTSLAGQTLSVLRVDGEKLDVEAKLIRTATGLNNSVGFEYDFFSVVDHKERPIKLFYYDDAKREFRFPVVIEDKDIPQGRVTDKFIKYRFDGKYFVKAG